MEKKQKQFNRKNVLLLFFVAIMFFSFFCFPKQVVAAHIEEEDSLDDVWKISALDFFYVLGDEWPDDPDDIDDVEEILEKLVARSDEVSKPDCVDIDTVFINTDDANWTAVIVEMEDDIDSCDFVEVIGILEDSNGNWIEFEMLYDDGTEEYEWSSEDYEGNDTTGGTSGDQIGIAIPRSECNYKEGDDFIIIAYTFTGDESDILSSKIYFDFCPNSAVPEDELGDMYTGVEPITNFISQISEFLFGWAFHSYVPFLLFIAILLCGAQCLFDRKSRILHYVGMVLLILLLYPMVFFAIQINLVGAFGIVDVFGMIAVISLISFMVFVPISILNNYDMFKRYKIPYTSGLSSMISFETIYLILFASSAYVLSLIGIVAICVGLWACLKVSRRFNPKK